MTTAEDYSEDFSQIPGFRLQDFDVKCVITGETCQTKVDLVVDYVGEGVLRTEDGEPTKRDYTNRAKLIAKLTEYKLVDGFIDYEGREPDACPTRDAMNASPVRQSAVKGIRKLIHFSKG